MQTIKRFLSSIDIFDKSLDEEFRIRTRTGATISVIFSFLGVILFMAHLNYFATPEIDRKLGLSRNITGGNSLVNISIGLLVDFPCHLLRLDVGDSLGFTELFANTVTRRRYSKNLHNYLGIAEYPSNKTCGSCYGLRPDNECCNSCGELVLLSLRNGTEPLLEEWPQCSGVSRSSLPTWDESCYFKGKLTVNKVPGQFQVVSTRNGYEYKPFNLSHIFDRLRFGPKLPETTTLLEDSRVVQLSSEPVRVTYTLLCTPVVLVRDETDVIARSFEYTISRAVMTSEKESGQPGIYVLYEFTPHTINVNFRLKSVLEMLPSVLSVMAGCYVVASFLDSLLFTTASATLIE